MFAKYILVDGQVHEEKDLFKWAHWMEQADLTVARYEMDDVVVSTIFLSIPVSYVGEVPLLFESLIMGGPQSGYRNWYATLEEAMAGHSVAVQILKGEFDEDKKS